MVACGVGVTFVPSVSTPGAQPPAVHRPLHADLVEMSLVRRAGDEGPLVREFHPLSGGEPLELA